MNIFQSLWLIREIYWQKSLPDLDKIQALGLLAVKIGQMHALRLDFLPADKCQHLSRLYRQASPIAAEDVQGLLNLAGPNFRHNFSNWSEEPVASASVGQVYKATLKTGQVVAVKLIKNRFKARFTADVAKLRKFFNLVLKLYPRLRQVGDPLGILNDVETYTMAELDLRREMAGDQELDRICQAYSERFDLSMLAKRRYYPELSSENILVSDFILAPSVDELLEQGRFSYQDMIKLFYVQGFYIFIAGRFHGDLHPGNVLFDGQRFYFVDTAFIAQVGDRLRRGLFFFFEALSRYDYKTCAYFLNQMADQGLTGQKYDNFVQSFQELYQDFAGRTVSEVSLTRQMMLTIKLGVKSGMVFESGIFPIIRSLMYLDGMVLKCNPRAILMENMRSFVTAYQEFVDQSPLV